MANIDEIRLRVAKMVLEKQNQKMKQKLKKCKPVRAEAYMKDRLDGMTFTAIAKKHGVSHQAVSQACARYKRRMELEAKYG